MRQDQNSALFDAAIPGQPNMNIAPTPPAEPVAGLTDEEINRIGKAKYEQKFAALVDTEENQGKFFLLNVITDDYQIADKLLPLLKEAERSYVGNNFYVCRIGRDTLFRIV